MTQTYSYEHRVLIVWSIEALEFRICSVLRALYFEFDIQPPLCPLFSVFSCLQSAICNLPAPCCLLTPTISHILPVPKEPFFSYAGVDLLRSPEG
jgi:hypothetical protein